MISGNIPSWLTELPQKCPFLLPFDLRRFLFYISTFDRQRAIQKMLERMPEYEVCFKIVLDLLTIEPRICINRDLVVR